MSRPKKDLANTIKQIDPKAFLGISREKWDTDNQIPPRLRPFFINLATLMEISRPIPENPQVIDTGKFERAIVCQISGCTEDEFYENLEIICKTDALRKVGFTLYAINPAYIVYGVDE